MQQIKNELLSIRPLSYSDIDMIVNYWCSSPSDFLQGMGVDLEKLPNEQQMTNMLTSQLDLSIEKRRSNCIIWEHNGLAIGHCNTNPTIYGEEAYMHLHIWKPEYRIKGLGLELVKLTIPWFFKHLQLKTLFSEPYALNPAPNKTLENAGFVFEKEYVTTPGSINFEQPVKKWVMTAKRFETLYLDDNN